NDLAVSLSFSVNAPPIRMQLEGTLVPQGAVVDTQFNSQLFCHLPEYPQHVLSQAGRGRTNLRRPARVAVDPLAVGVDPVRPDPQQPLLQKLRGEFVAYVPVGCRGVEIIVDAEEGALVPIRRRLGRR